MVLSQWQVTCNQERAAADFVHDEDCDVGGDHLHAVDKQGSVQLASNASAKGRDATKDLHMPGVKGSCSAKKRC